MVWKGQYLLVQSKEHNNYFVSEDKLSELNMFSKNYQSENQSV